MQRLSSNLTLFFKIFVPVSWASFFGLFGLVIFILKPMDEPFLTSTFFRIGYVVAFLAFFAFIYFTIFQLKRVETDNTYMYVTNYFKTIRFPIENVRTMRVTNLGLFKLARLHLQNGGIFGSKIAFLTTRVDFAEFCQRNPSLLK